MKYGVNTLLWTAAFDQSHFGLLASIKEAGFDGVEIARFEFSSFPAADVRRETGKVGLEPIFLSALTGDASILTDDTSVRQRSLSFIKDGIRVAADVGSKVFVGPFLSAVGLSHGRRRTHDEWQRGIEGLQSLGDTLASCDIILAVEPLNRFETFAMNTAEDAFRVVRSSRASPDRHPVRHLHAHIEEKDTGAAIRRLGKHVKHVHTCENDRGTPGTGQVQWDKVFPALSDIGYSGWLVIESFGQNVPEIAAAACIWRDLAPSTESIMTDGIRFLKSRV